MVEAMLEVVLANYFRKIQSNFELVVTEKIPILSTLKMYASESHFKCEFSLFSRTPPKLVMICWLNKHLKNISKEYLVSLFDTLILPPIQQLIIRS